MSEFGMVLTTTLKVPILIYWNYEGDLVIQWVDESGKRQAAVLKAQNIGEKTTSKRRRRT